MSSAMLVPMRLRDRVLGAISFVTAESGRRFDAPRPAAGRGPRAARRDRGRERAPVPRRARRSRDAAGVAAAAGAAGHPGRRRRRDLPAGRRGLEVGGDFYDVFSTAEDQWYRGHRRRLRQGRRGGGGDRARALHDPRRRGRGAARPRAILRWLSDAMVQQADDAALLHDRLRAPRPQPRRRARDRVLRRPPAADRACAPTGAIEDAGRAAARCSASSTTPSCDDRAPSCARRHHRALHRRADRGGRAAARVDAGGAHRGGLRLRARRRAAAGRLRGRRPRSRISSGRRATTSRSSRCGSRPPSSGCRSRCRRRCRGRALRRRRTRSCSGSRRSGVSSTSLGCSSG